MGALVVEQVRALHLDRDMRLIVDEIVAVGNNDGCLLPIRPLLRRAVALDSSALILVHNHPSGDPTPSRADIFATRRLEKCASSLSIVIADHLIVATDRALSFREEGLL